MASPGNRQHCANCIGTLFAIRTTLMMWCRATANSTSRLSFSSATGRDSF